jgi:hypothetical protein
MDQGLRIRPERPGPRENLAAIHRENAGQAPDLKSMGGIIHSSNYRIAKAIGNSIRARFNLLPSSED